MIRIQTFHVWLPSDCRFAAFGVGIFSIQMFHWLPSDGHFVASGVGIF